MAEPVLNIETDPSEELRTVPLDALHRRLGAKMVDFAGYSLPVQYGPGVMTEHRHTREKASLFDVSHMGQFSLYGEDAAKALEAVVPGDIQGLAVGRQRYTVLLNEAGGIDDDLMVANYGDRLMIVANAARKDYDAHILAEHLPGLRIEQHPQRALLALQGPSSGAVMAQLCPEAAALRFLGVVESSIGGQAVWISRSGYSGEDGFEISVREEAAEAVAEMLLAHPDVLPAGLGARDSLRLEAGLCLYGQDIDEVTTPVEANLAWTIAKRRRDAADFLGAAPILDQLQHGTTRLRVGIRPAGRAPARAETPILAPDGTSAGHVTSGGFSPTLQAPVAMGYVRRELAELGTALGLLIRKETQAAEVAALPFVPTRYAK